MNYTTLVEPVEPLRPLEERDAHSLYAAFEQISDGRCERGVRYSLALLLTLIVLAKLTGEVTMSGVVDWVRLRHDWLTEVLGLTHKRLPCFSTYTCALGELDTHTCATIISAALTRLETTRRCAAEPSRLLTQEGRGSSEPLAFDGKALRGTNGHEAAHQPPVHLCAFDEVATGNVVAQREGSKKENEISAVKEMLTPELVKGRVISADAMHTQRFFCQTIEQYGGKYVLIAKDNQPTMREDLALFFEDPDAPREGWQTFTSMEKGHGRLEKRVVTTSTEMRDWFANEWSGIEQVFRVERTVTRKGQTSNEVVYGISSLSLKDATAQQLAGSIRDHWAIENRLHWRRDVTMQEDHSQRRTERVPSILSSLNSTILALMDLQGVSNVPAQMRRFNAAPLFVLPWLFGTL